MNNCEVIFDEPSIMNHMLRDTMPLDEQWFNGELAHTKRYGVQVRMGENVLIRFYPACGSLLPFMDVSSVRTGEVLSVFPQPTRGKFRQLFIAFGVV